MIFFFSSSSIIHFFRAKVAPIAPPAVSPSRCKARLLSRYQHALPQPLFSLENLRALCHRRQNGMLHLFAPKPIWHSTPLQVTQAKSTDTGNSVAGGFANATNPARCFQLRLLSSSANRIPSTKDTDRTRSLGPCFAGARPGADPRYCTPVHRWTTPG